MAFSGTISATVFSANRIVDHAFRRCRLPAQAITSEMQSYALDALYLMLSEMANVRAPSWAIEKILLPLRQGLSDVALPAGTVDVLNVNFRTTSPLLGTVTTGATLYQVQFAGATQVSTVGITWGATGVAVTFEVSADGIMWIPVGSLPAGAASGTKVWADVNPTGPFLFFRIVSLVPMTLAAVYLGGNPSEVPLTVISRDTYTSQVNRTYQGRPSMYWYQRDLPQPILRLWSAPDLRATDGTLVIWRHRHIMDTSALRQDVEVPQRWLEAIIAGLAAKVAMETPSVDVALIPMLDGKAATAMQIAWDGDGDASPTVFQPMIRQYTR